MAFTVTGKIDGDVVTYTWDNGKITCTENWAMADIESQLWAMKELGVKIWTPARLYQYSENFLQDPRNALVLICNCLDVFISDSGDVPETDTNPGNGFR
jgi:hypothetical protein